MPNTVHNLLQKCNTTVCCLDNNQKGHPLKFQRYGVSNKFVKVTGNVIKECIEFPNQHIDNHTNLSYTNQKVPSPHMMPHYEVLLSTESQQLNDRKALQALLHTSHFTTFMNNATISPYDEHTVDFSGKKIDTSYKLCHIVQVSGMGN